MNCQDVVAFVIEPGTGPVGVEEHLQSCAPCRARVAESRRVASLMADLPVVPGTDIAGRVMSRIGYGNGRPTRDKILDQLSQIRSELEAVVEEVNGAVYRRPASGEPSVADLLSHLPSLEATAAAQAEAALMPPFGASRFVVKQEKSGGRGFGGNGHTHTANAGEVTVQDLRRVRERTLQLISDVDPRCMDQSTAETLRSVYRHEADHAAQMSDVLWRMRRKDQLAEGDGH